MSSRKCLIVSWVPKGVPKTTLVAAESATGIGLSAVSMPDGLHSLHLDRFTCNPNLANSSECFCLRARRASGSPTSTPSSR